MSTQQNAVPVCLGFGYFREVRHVPSGHVRTCADMSGRRASMAFKRGFRGHLAVSFLETSQDISRQHHQLMKIYEDI